MRFNWLVPERIVNSKRLIYMVLILVSLAVVVQTVRQAIPDNVIGLDLAPGYFLSHIFSTYSSTNMGQRIGGSQIAYWPVAVIYAVLNSLGASILHIQWIWITILFSFASTGAARLYFLWWQTENAYLGLLAGVIYGFSPYVVFNLQGATAMMIPYSAAPWLAISLVLLVRRSKRKYAFIAALIGGILGVGVNPPLTIIMVLTGFAIGLAELARSENKRNSAKVLVCAAILVVLVSLWWILPFVENSLLSGGASSYFITDPISEGASNSSVGEILRLTGLWALYGGFDGKPYISSAPFFLSVPVTIVTSIAPLLAIFVLRSQWRDRGIRVFGILFVFVLWMGVAAFPLSAPPQTSQLYLWFYNHFFVFRAFRSNYKWVSALALLYAILVPYVGVILWRSLSPPRRALELVRSSAVGGMALLSMSYLVPFVNQETFSSMWHLGTVPSYWYRASNWLDNQSSSGRALLLPVSGFSLYSWGNPYGDIGSVLMKRPDIVPHVGSTISNQANLLLNDLNLAATNPNIPFNRILQLFGARFVIQQNDANWQYYNSPSPSEMQHFLGSDKDLRLVKTFGELDIYELKLSVSSALGTSKNIGQLVSDSNVVADVASMRPGTANNFQIATFGTQSVSSVTASSVWYGHVRTFGPQRVLFGSPKDAWVTGITNGIGQWIQLNFRKSMPLGKVTVMVRKDGVDALPKELLVQLPDKGISKLMQISKNGVGAVDFGSDRSNSLRITIEKIGSGGGNVGISEVQFQGVGNPEVIYPTLKNGTFSGYQFNFAKDRRSGEGLMPHVVPVRDPVNAVVTGECKLNPIETESDLKRYVNVTGVSDIQASSVKNGSILYSPWLALTGSPGISWISDTSHSLGQWVQIDFKKPTWIGSIELLKQNESSSSAITTVNLTAGKSNLGNRSISWNSSGVAQISVDASIASLRISVSGVRQNRSNSGVGFGISIPGVTASVTSNKSVPILYMDGNPMNTAIKSEKTIGPMGTLFPNYVFSTDIALTPGVHIFTMPLGNTLYNCSVSLDSGSVDDTVIHNLASQKFSSTSYVVQKAGVDRYLILENNFDFAWHANQNGASLTPYEPVNAFAQSWLMKSSSAPVPIYIHFQDGSSPGRLIVYWLLGMCSLAVMFSGIAFLLRRIRRNAN